MLALWPAEGFEIISSVGREHPAVITCLASILLNKLVNICAKVIIVFALLQMSGAQTGNKRFCNSLQAFRQDHLWQSLRWQRGGFRVAHKKGDPG